MSKYTGINQQIARAHLGRYVKEEEEEEEEREKEKGNKLKLNHFVRFGLSGDLALRTINTLSGGQKVHFSPLSSPYLIHSLTLLHFNYCYLSYSPSNL